VTIKNLLQAADIKEVLTNAMLLEARAPCLALLKSRNAPPDAKFSHAHRADSTTVFSHLESFPHNRDVFATEPNSESQAEMFKCSSTLVTAYPALPFQELLAVPPAHTCIEIRLITIHPKAYQCQSTCG
jgi:hypothetical protein